MPVYYLISLGTISKYDNITPIFVDKGYTGLGANQNTILIDRRPQNGIFYIIGQEDGVQATLYEVNPETNPNATLSNPVNLTLSSNPFFFPSTFIFGDFDPVNDVLTVVEGITTYTVNPITGVVTVTNTLTGGTPYGIAYTNNVSPTPGSTTLYDIGRTMGNNRLFIQQPDGTLVDQGPLTYVNVADFGEMDIITPAPNVNLAYAFVATNTPAGPAFLYQIDLIGVSAISLGQIPYPNPATLSGFALLSTSIPCLHPDTVCETPSGPVKISDLRSGDKVLTQDGRQVEIINNARMSQTSSLCRVMRNCISKESPSKDLLITTNHPMLHNGKEITARSLRREKGKSKCKNVNLDSPVNVWTLVTKEHEFVMMQNVPVGTWAFSDFMSKKYECTLF